jgi:ornithine cyclodeaminase
MTGGLAEGEGFGAKLISVFPENHGRGLPSHRGVVLLHEEESGAPVCLADASEITRIRTAAASAAATDALARPGPAVLAILGCGEQARAHAFALARVREIKEIRIWGRDPEKAERVAAELAAALGLRVESRSSVAAAVSGADIVCTTTAASEPILSAGQLMPGAHVNLVGSSRAGPAEADISLVAQTRFIVDSRENVLAQGAEFHNALAAGVVDEGHIAAEIGDVFAGRRVGRQSDEEITVYKSLGHVVQDIAALRFLNLRARACGKGNAVPF